MWVIQAPQKNMPEAWLVLRGKEYESSLERRYGREQKFFPPHPEERRRFENTMGEMREREKTGEVWNPGEPWLDSVSGLLIDKSGRQLAGEFWIGAGCLADFDGDGLLDLFQVSRYHSKGKSRVIDGLSVGSLDPAEARDTLWFCNFAKDRFRTNRDWKFRILEADGEGVGLRFVSTKSGLEFEFTEELSKDATKPVFQVSEPEGRRYQATANFFETIGEAIGGVGTDDVDDLDADLHVTSPAEFDHRFGIPAVDGLSPRETARLIVSSGQSSVNQENFVIASAGPEVGIPTRGWLEGSSDGGCWLPVSATIWALDGDEASKWDFGRDENGDFLERVKVSADRVAWTMATVAELHQIRSVPRHPLVSLRQNRFGSSNAPASMVRLLIGDPPKRKVVTPEVRLWDLVELSGRYHRDHAAAFATVLLDHLSESEEPVVRERLDWRQAGKRWFETGQVRGLPPILVRRLVQLAGDGKWQEYRDDFRKLRAEVKQANQEAGRRSPLKEIAELMPEVYLKTETEKDRRTLSREARKLRENLTGNYSFELEDALDSALKKLGEE